MKKNEEKFPKKKKVEKLKIKKIKSCKKKGKENNSYE